VGVGVGGAKNTSGELDDGGGDVCFFSSTLTTSGQTAQWSLIKLAPSCPEGGWSPALVDTVSGHGSIALAGGSIQSRQ
jgi:hypothetical protein